MPNRYYSPELAIDRPGQTVTIQGSEAHHIINVMRQNVGDTIELFDGRGGIASAVITNQKKGYVELNISHQEIIDPLREKSRISVAAAIPKGERFRWMIEKLTELGSDQFIPLITKRSVVTPRDGKIEKMQQTVIAAMKQSRRLIEMPIAEPMEWKSLLEQFSPDHQLLIADPTGTNIDQSQIDFSGELLICIGPEGGFTDQELQAGLAAGAQLVSLGDTILRTETAAIAATACCRFRLK